jgi:hypothetical protein
MLAAKRTKLLELKTLCCGLFVFRVAVIPTFALVALQLNNFARHPADSFL